MIKVEIIKTEKFNEATKLKLLLEKLRDQVLRQT